MLSMFDSDGDTRSDFLRFSEILRLANPSDAGLFCLEIDTQLSLKLLPRLVFHCFNLALKVGLRPGFTLFWAEEVKVKSLDPGDVDGEGLLDALLDRIGLNEDKQIDEFCFFPTEILHDLIIGRVLFV